MATRSEIRAMVLELGEELAKLEQTVNWMEKGHKKTMLEMILPIIAGQQKIISEIAGALPAPARKAVITNNPDMLTSATEQLERREEGG